MVVTDLAGLHNILDVDGDDPLLDIPMEDDDPLEPESDDLGEDPIDEE